MEPEIQQLQHMLLRKLYHLSERTQENMIIFRLSFSLMDAQKAQGQII